MDSKGKRVPSTSEEDDKSRAKKPKTFCHYNKNWEHKYAWIGPAGPGMDTGASCTICGCTFTVKWDGEAAVKKHAKCDKHQRKVQQQREGLGTKLESKDHDKDIIVVSEDCSESHLVMAAELTELYHGIQHHHSYLSIDCGIKLAHRIYSDSNIASKISCGRTKAKNTVTNVLAPFAEDLLLKEMGDSFYSVASYASNRGKRKLVPIAVQYFHAQKGIQRKLLDIYEGRNETADALAVKVTATLLNKGLKLERLSSCTADHASVNYEKNHSVFQSLKSRVPHLMPPNCFCHIIQNCARHASKALDRLDVETLVIKIYMEFSTTAHRTDELKELFQFVDSEGSDLLGNVVTSWLSLLPAINRLLLCWPAVKSFFLSQGPDECSSVIWNIFTDQNYENDETDELTEGECHLYFMQHIMEVFRKSIASLESTKLVATEVYGIMLTLKLELEKRLEDNFYGEVLSVALEKFSESKIVRLINDFSAFLKRAVFYLKQWFHFDASPLRAIQVLCLAQKELTWQDLKQCRSVLKLENVLSMCELYTDYVKLSHALPKLYSMPLSVEGKWVEFFQNEPSCNTLLKLIQFVLSIPVSNSFVERVFSIVGNSWTDERNRMSIELLKAELQVKVNYEYTCSQFYAFAKSHTKLLEAAKSNRKYAFKAK